MIFICFFSVFLVSFNPSEKPGTSLSSQETGWKPATVLLIEVFQKWQQLLVSKSGAAVS